MAERRKAQEALEVAEAKKAKLEREAGQRKKDLIEKKLAEAIQDATNFGKITKERKAAKDAFKAAEQLRKQLEETERLA